MSETAPTINIVFRCPVGLVEAMDGYRRRLGLTRSQLCRQAVVFELRQAGLWPPTSCVASDGEVSS